MAFYMAVCAHRWHISAVAHGFFVMGSAYAAKVAWLSVPVGLLAVWFVGARLGISLFLGSPIKWGVVLGR